MCAWDVRSKLLLVNQACNGRGVGFQKAPGWSLAPQGGDDVDGDRPGIEEIPAGCLR